MQHIGLTRVIDPTEFNNFFLVKLFFYYMIKKIDAQ
jgi:hypothetical protein